MNNITYNTIYIVGNGLDICCGIQSSYANFMSSLKNNITELPYLIQYLYETHEKKLWTDLECELGNIANRKFAATADYRIFGLMSDHKQFKSDFQTLQNLLVRFLKHVSDSMDIDKFPFKSVLKNTLEDIYLLNFNYTFTIEKYLNEYCNNRHHKINHIHGTLNDKIIVGVQDSQELKKEQTFLYKTKHVNPKDVLELNNVLKSASNIVFLGYSLGESDHSYFEDLFHEQSQVNAKKKKFVFYYYGEEGHDDLDYNLRILTNNKLTLFYAMNEVEFIDSKRLQKLPRMH